MHVRSLARDLLGLIVSGLSFPGVASAADGHVVMSKARQVRVSPAGEPAGAVVARGERETGFQPVSERIHSRGVAWVGPSPAALQPGAAFAGAVTTSARAPEEALTLLRFPAAPEAAATLLKAGLTPPQAR